MFPNLEEEPLEGELHFSAFQRNVKEAFRYDYPSPPHRYIPRACVKKGDGSFEPDWLIEFNGAIDLAIEAKEAEVVQQSDVRQAKEYAEAFSVSAVICISQRCKCPAPVEEAIRNNQLGLLVFDDETKDWEWIVEL